MVFTCSPSQECVDDGPKRWAAHNALVIPASATLNMVSGVSFWDTQAAFHYIPARSMASGSICYRALYICIFIDYQYMFVGLAHIVAVPELCPYHVRESGAHRRRARTLSVPFSWVRNHTNTHFVLSTDF